MAEEQTQAQVPTRQILLFHIQFALVVLGLLLGRTVRDALYLSRAGVDQLPLLYAAVGVIVAAAALAWGRLQMGRTLRSTAIVLHGVAAAVFAGFAWLAPFAGDGLWAALYLWVEVLAALSVGQFWNVVNERFDTRTARRVYGRIAAGQALGNLAVGAIARLIAGKGAGVMLGTTAAVTGASAVLYLFVPGGPPHAQRRRPGQGRLLARQRSRVANRRQAWAWTLLLLVAVTYLVTSWVDFQFKVIARRQLDEHDLTVFFGTFYGAVGVTAFVIQLFVFPRLSQWLGSFRAMSLMPAAFLFTGVLLPIATTLTQALSTTAKFAESTLRYAVFDPLLQVFWLPLPPAERTRFQSLASGVVKPLAIAVGGLILWPLRPDTVQGVDAEYLGWPIAAGAATILCLLWLLRRRYVALLAEQVQRAHLVGRATSLERVDASWLADVAVSAPAGAAIWIARRLLVDTDPGHRPAALALLERDDLPLHDRIALAWTWRVALPLRTSSRAAAAIRQVCALVEAAGKGRLTQPLDPDSRIEVARLAALQRNIPVDAAEALPRPETVRPEVLAAFWSVTGPRVRDEWTDALVEVGAWMHIRRLIQVDDGAFSSRQIGALLRDARGRIAIAEALAAGGSASWRMLAENAPEPVWRWLGPLWWPTCARLAPTQREQMAAAMSAEQDPWYLVPLTVGSIAVLRGPQAVPERWLEAAELYAAAAAAAADGDSRVRLRRAGMLRRCECAVTLAVRLWMKDGDAALYHMTDRGVWNDPQRRNALAEAIDSEWPGPAHARSRLLNLIDRLPAPRLLPDHMIATLDWRLALVCIDTEVDMTLAGMESKVEPKELLSRLLALADVPLFANLESEELALIAEVVEPVECAAGERLIRQGDIGDSLYVIVDGSVRVEIDGRCVAELSTGAVVGEMAVIDQQPRSADVIAGATPVRALRLWKEDFDLLLDAWPQIGRGVMQVLSQRLRVASRPPG